MNWALAPLSWIYGRAVRARLWGYEHGWARVHALGRPVISVGNLTVGGTGKTPVVIAIGETLLARGVGVAVLSRGYRGRAERDGALVSDGRATVLGWEEAGDEPALIARRLPRAAVIVGRDRSAVWRRFSDRLPPGVVILDDGFQHLSIARDEDVVLLDATEDVGNGALLPRGRMREPLAALSRATAVVITRVDQADQAAVAALEQRLRVERPDLPVFRARFEPLELIEVGTARALALDRLKGVRGLAVAGIGRFESFTRLLAGCGAVVTDAMRFEDHHAYRAADVERITARLKETGAERAITTEKDAVKLDRVVPSGGSFWAVRIRAHITPEAPWRAMLDRLAQRVKGGA